MTVFVCKQSFFRSVFGSVIADVQKNKHTERQTPAKPVPVGHDCAVTAIVRLSDLCQINDGTDKSLQKAPSPLEKTV